MKSLFGYLFNFLAFFFIIANLNGSMALAQNTSDGNVRVNNVTADKARFTVITPECIRLEYSDKSQFVDAPSLFAANRDARLTEFKYYHTATETFIDTGIIQLTYTPDGHPFSDKNLKAIIHVLGSAPITWTPSMKNKQNLGGTLNSLDHVSGPKAVSDGLLSRDGWYLLDDSHRFILENGWVAKRPPSAGSDWYLFGYGLDYKGALHSLTTIGGAVPMPRRYVLGSWYSRWWPYTSNDYRQIVKEYHDHDFPLDIIVDDMDWHKKDNWSGYTWDRNLFPDAENYLKWVHDQHLFVTLNDHPEAGVGTYEERYPEFMKAMGKDPTKKEVLGYNSGDQKYLTTLFKFMHEPLEKMGVDFWWVDWMGNDKYFFNRIDWINEFYYMHSKQTGLRGQQFSRWADWGDHRHPIHFSGDTQIEWPVLAFEVPFTAESSNAGAFFWTHDMGGFTGARNGEMLARWVQFGAFSAALRLHSSNKATLDKRPWSYSKNVEESMKVAFHLRSEFFPYTYSRVYEASNNSLPLIRSLYLDYPKMEEAYHNPQEYLYGSDILVAPIVSPGKGITKLASQKVWFPPGLWYDYFTGAAYWGQTEKTFTNDLNTLPLFLRGGAPITMQPFSERMATDPLKTLVVRVYPGVDGVLGHSNLYEDDGLTEKYLSGEKALTTLDYIKHGEKTELRISGVQGTFNGQLSKRSYVIEFPAEKPWRKVTVDGKVALKTYDALRGILQVPIPERDIRMATQIEISN